MFVIETVYEHHHHPLFWLTHTHTHTHTHTVVFTKQVFVGPPFLSCHSVAPRLRRGGGRTLSGKHSNHASAITIKDEEINFGHVSLCSGHGLFENNQGSMCRATMQAWKKAHIVRNTEWLNLGLNTMVTGHIELMVIYFFKPIWELNTWKIEYYKKQWQNEKDQCKVSSFLHNCAVKFKYSAANIDILEPPIHSSCTI